MIGHSLGGIALVDCLALAAARGEAPAGLRLLVTVGSQAPFLHELGALNGLEPGAALPAGFPAWLNVYDPGDVLGYRAAPVFPGDPRVTDHEVSSRQPFPYCHSAYFKLPALYDRIAAALDGAAPAAGPEPAGPVAAAPVAAAPPAVPAPGTRATPGPPGDRRRRRRPRGPRARAGVRPGRRHRVLRRGSRLEPPRPGP
ncbi:hypothetical protein ACFQ0M_05705 [Kitasatospora aburaviensis]